MIILNEAIIDTSSNSMFAECKRKSVRKSKHAFMDLPSGILVYFEYSTHCYKALIIHIKLVIYNTNLCHKTLALSCRS